MYKNYSVQAGNTIRIIFHMRIALPLYLLIVHGIMNLQHAKAGEQRERYFEKAAKRGKDKCTDTQAATDKRTGKRK